MTVRTLIKHGRSYALVIPRALMQQLGIRPDTELKLSVDGQAIRIEPVREKYGPNLELIRARKKFHVSLLKKSLLPAQSKIGEYRKPEEANPETRSPKRLCRDSPPNKVSAINHARTSAG